MTKPIILKAEDFDDMESIAEPFINKGYKIMSSDGKHILAKKRNFGNRYIHILFLFLIMFTIPAGTSIIWIVCLIYCSYFIYYLFKKSKVVLVTTESKDTDGNNVEFDKIEEIEI